MLTILCLGTASLQINLKYGHIDPIVGIVWLFLMCSILPLVVIFQDGLHLTLLVLYEGMILGVIYLICVLIFDQTLNFRPFGISDDTSSLVLGLLCGSGICFFLWRQRQKKLRKEA